MSLKNNILFSIIVPVYNSERFIDRCVKSILEQTYEKWELILVDDASKDKSLLLCKNYNQKYPDKIKLITSEKNEGQLSSRFKGALESTGNYILFLDSDDSLCNNSLNVIFDVILNQETDLISFNPNLINIKGKKDIYLFEKEKRLDGSNNLIVEYLCKKIYGYSCFFAFKKQIVIDAFDGLVNFNYLRYTEDLIFMFKVLSISESCFQVPHKIYNYFINDNSMSTSVSIDKYRDRFASFDFIYGHNLDSHMIEDDVKKEIIYCILSYAREVCFVKDIKTRPVIKTIRNSSLFEKYKKNIKLKDLLSRLLFILLRLRIYRLFCFIVRKYYHCRCVSN